MAKKPRTVKKTSTQKVSMGRGLRSGQKAGYETTPKSNRGAGAFHTYAHREGSGPKNGLGSADVSKGGN